MTFEPPPENECENCDNRCDGIAPVAQPRDRKRNASIDRPGVPLFQIAGDELAIRARHELQQEPDECRRTNVARKSWTPHRRLQPPSASASSRLPTPLAMLRSAAHESRRADAPAGSKR